MMKALYEKHNKQSNERRLKKEAKLLSQSASAIYWYELEKEPESRDSELMLECLQVIKQSSAVFAGGKNRKTASFMVMLRRAAAVCGVILALLAVSAGVAHAAGVNVWQIFIKPDKNELKISGVSPQDNSQQQNDMTEYNQAEYVECKTVKEATDILGEKILIFDLTKHGYMIENIYVAKADAVSELIIEYSSKEDHYIEYSVQIFTGNTAFEKGYMGDFSKTATVGNITVYFLEVEDETVAVWNEENIIYTIYSDISQEEIIEIIEEIKLLS